MSLFSTVSRRFFSSQSAVREQAKEKRDKAAQQCACVVRSILLPKQQQPLFASAKCTKSKLHKLQASTLTPSLLPSSPIVLILLEAKGTRFLRPPNETQSSFRVARPNLGRPRANIGAQLQTLAATTLASFGAAQLSNRSAVQCIAAKARERKREAKAAPTGRLCKYHLQNCARSLPSRRRPKSLDIGEREREREGNARSRAQTWEAAAQFARLAYIYTYIHIRATQGPTSGCFTSAARERAEVAPTALCKLSGHQAIVVRRLSLAGGQLIVVADRANQQPTKWANLNGRKVLHKFSDTLALSFFLSRLFRIIFQIELSAGGDHCAVATVLQPGAS